MLNAYTYVQTWLARAQREEGQTMAEYAVVLAVVTLLVIGAITLLSTNIGNAITTVAGVPVNSARFGGDGVPGRRLALSMSPFAGRVLGRGIPGSRSSADHRIDPWRCGTPHRWEVAPC